MPPTGMNPRRLWFVLWAAFTAAPVIYGVVAFVVAPGMSAASHPPPVLRIVFAALAVVTLVAGTLLMSRAPRARSGAPGLVSMFGGEAIAEPPAFQAAFITATAFVESCAIYGFVLVFLGSPAIQYLPFGGATVAVMLGVALPVGTRYWDARERAELDSSAPPPIN